MIECLAKIYRIFKRLLAVKSQRKTGGTDEDPSRSRVDGGVGMEDTVCVHHAIVGLEAVNQTIRDSLGVGLSEEYRDELIMNKMNIMGRTNFAVSSGRR